MNDTPTIEVHRQKALFSRDLPFKPQYGMMLYVEACANEEINGYFHENMEKALNILCANPSEKEKPLLTLEKSYDNETEVSSNDK